MAANGHESQQAMPDVGVANPPRENVASKAPRRRPLFLCGVLLFLLGPVVYIVLFNLKYLGMPWYVPILGTAGVLLMLLSVWHRPGIVRGAALVLFVLLCAGEWFFGLVATKTPDYTGPAQVGSKLPVFATSLAGGASFTSKDLESGAPTVLVFFRGRW
jgi:hypothetical protein